MEKPTVTTTSTSGRKVPTVEDQVRDYRLNQRLKHNLARKFRKARSQVGLRSLESQLDPEQQLKLSQGK